ncbi:dipeptidylpeptidase, partial [Spiromyces aspiralis]
MAPKLIPLVAQFACWCGAMIVATGLLAHAVGSLSHSQSPSLSIPAAIQQEGLRPLNIELFHALDAISIPRLIPGVPDKAIYGLRSYYQVNDTSYLVPHLLDLATAQSVQLLPAEECKDINMIFPIDNSHYGYTINSTLHIRGLPLASNSGAGTHFNYTWPVDVWGFSYNADTKRLFFLSSVYPNMTLEQTAEHDEYLSKHKFDSARIYDNLWIRHWNRWMIPKKTNIFVTSMVQDSNGNWTIGEPRNLMAGLPHFTSDPNLQPDSNTYTV